MCCLINLQIADLYEQAAVNASGSASNYTSKADLHRKQGDTMKEALFDLFWDNGKLHFSRLLRAAAQDLTFRSDKLAFYDFDSASSKRSDFFSLAAYVSRIRARR